jgi:hypothetical protein
MASHRGQKKQMAVETPARKRRAARRAASVSRTRPVPATDVAVPGWDALTHAVPRKPNRLQTDTAPSLTTARYTLWLTAIALAVTLYVGHVHATQQVFETLHALKKESLHLHLQLDQLRGELDRTAGPAVLYPKARRLGLKEGAAFGPTISTTP